MQRKYSIKFKNHAIQQVLGRSEHQTIPDVAMNLKVNISTLKQWLKFHRRKNKPTVKLSDENLHEEIAFLKEELARKDKLIIETTALLVYGKVA